MNLCIPGLGNTAAGQALNRFCQEIFHILGDHITSIYLHGSAAVSDFRPGWSDLDLLVLTDAPIPDDQAECLLCLRQTLTQLYPENPFYRTMEGAVLPLYAFTENKTAPNIVYYGTGSQRITDHYEMNALSRTEWFTNGILLYGSDIRDDIALLPPYEDLVDAIDAHLNTVFRYGCTPSASLYSYGWICDLCRCLYTLETGKIISKTEALRYALTHPAVPSTLYGVISETYRVRTDPKTALEDPDTLTRAAALGSDIRHMAECTEAVLRTVRAREHRCFCGHNCGRCHVYLAAQTNDPKELQAAINFYRSFSGITLTPEETVCHGGRSDTRMILCRECPFRSCCEMRGINSCHTCSEYPCTMIADYEKTCVNRMGQAAAADSIAMLRQTAYKI